MSLGLLRLTYERRESAGCPRAFVVAQHHRALYATKLKPLTTRLARFAGQCTPSPESPRCRQPPKHTSKAYTLDSALAPAQHACLTRYQDQWPRPASIRLYKPDMDTIATGQGAPRLVGHASHGLRSGMGCRPPCRAASTGWRVARGADDARC
jgi:hypothetical protein